MSKDRFFSGGGQSEIDSLNAYTYSNSGIVNTTAMKLGRVVQLTFYYQSAVSATSANSWVSLGTIKEEFRPQYEISAMLMDNGAANRQTMPLMVKITPEGTVSWYAYNATDTCKPRGIMTYISASKPQ